MGVKVSPDIAQQYITQILHDVLRGDKGHDVVVYIDDCGIWTTGDYDDHINLVDKVLQRLAANGMKCNPRKCDWAVKETDFLGYWMTPECTYDQHQTNGKENRSNPGNGKTNNKDRSAIVHRRCQFL